MGKRGLLGAVFCLLPFAAQAQVSKLAQFSFEVTPTIGKLLPYDLWGTPGTLTTYGLRTGYSLHQIGAAGVLEASFLYHDAKPDHAYTTDLGWNYEFAEQGLEVFFSIGFHYSYFSLKPDLDSDGNCVLSGCVTDSGPHSGVFLGGGLMIPLTATLPLRFAMRFYNKPQLWLLLETGLSIRF